MNKAEIILLDGGTGTELRERGVEVPCHRTSIWSARAIYEAPEEVVAVHREYIDAGSRVVTACNYAVTPTLLAREGMADRVEELTLLAVKLARRAAEDSGEEVRVAASLPPLDTSYRADLVAPDDELRAEYRRLADLLAPHVDVLLCETLSLGREAVAAAEAALAVEREVWLSWTLQGNRLGVLSGGETLEEVFAAAAHLPVHAHLVNCCGANLITDAMPRLRELSGGPIGGYANASNSLPGAFDPLDPETAPSEALGAAAYADAVMRWVSAGASIVGGCCHTSPAHIAEVRSRLSL